MKMENWREAIKSLMENKIITSLVVILISFLLYRIFHKIIMNGEKNSRINQAISKKSKTYFQFIINILRYVFVIVTILIILQINGIDVSSMLAGVGIASVIIGLAVQDALKDIIRGMNLISDNYFSIGDYIKYDNVEGKVLEIGLRTTKVQDIKTGTIMSIANRNIEQVGVITDWLFLSVPMPYEVTLEKAESIVETIAAIMREHDNVLECENKGVSELADSSIQYLLGMRCKPEYKLQVKRETFRTILEVLEKNNISVPYPQMDVHNK